jgi:stage II sporulation protein D
MPLALAGIAFACERPVETPRDAQADEPTTRETTRSGENDNRPLPPRREPDVRVKIASLDPLPSTCTVGSSGQRLLLLGGEPRRPFLLDGPVVLDANASGWMIRDESGRSLSMAPLCSISIRTLAGSPSTIAHGEMVLPGAIDLHLRSGNPTTRIDLVARMPIERYLPGVLDGELFSMWPLASFQAQAVAARSYAVAESGFWEDRRTYDVVAGPSSQAWSGLDNSERAMEAVSSTRGVLLVHEGHVIPAYYSSMCGGQSASAVDSISNRAGHRITPLQARSGDRAPCCEEAPLRTWTAEFDLGTLRNGLRAWGKAHEERGKGLETFGRLRSVSVLERNATRRPLSYELVDRAGKRIQLDAHTFRRALGTVPRSGGDEATSLYSEAFECSVRGNKLILRGRGFGHGVGLCQYGAKQMGGSGATWQAILQRYYPESDLTQAWTSHSGSRDGQK